MKVVDWKAIERKLRLEARIFLKEAYNFELAIPIQVNGRIKSTYGRFMHKATIKQSLRIEMSKNYIEHQEWNTIRETLIHECIHYALYERDLPYKDGEFYFENELRKHGSHSTGMVKYKGKVIEYACTGEGCGEVFHVKKRYPKNKTYITRCCNAPIKFTGEKMV